MAVSKSILDTLLSGSSVGALSELTGAGGDQVQQVLSQAIPPLIGGMKKMLVWNDLVADEKLRIYDKGITKTNGSAQDVHALRVSYRMGDVWAPRIDQIEALSAEAKYFVDCVENDKKPFNDAVAGLEVVRMLEAASKSLAQKGGMVYL